jgi:hypothetical protein
MNALNSQKLKPMKGTTVVVYIHEVTETFAKPGIKLNKNRIHIANNTLAQIKKRRGQ